MSELSKQCAGRFECKSSLRKELKAKLGDLDERQAELVLRFIDLVATRDDPDVVDDFLAWRSDPNLESIMQLAVAVDGELREQLLFLAEDLYSSLAPRH